MSDAGFMRFLCVYRIAPVNVSLDPLGDFRTEGMMARPQDKIREHYRARLADELGRYGRSQSALARHLGINQSAVSRMVSGERGIRLEEQAAIEEYLLATDPNPPETGAVHLPAEAEDATEPLEAYHDLLEAVILRKMEGTDEITSLLEVDNDYPVVMTCAAMLEFQLTAAVQKLVRDGVAQDPSRTHWYWEALVEKTEIVVAAGRLAESQAARMLAIFAIRDAFAHSRVMLSLLDDAVRPITEQAIAYGYMRAADLARTRSDPQEHGAGANRAKAVRLEFVLTATAITHQLLVNDPAKTAALFLELANKAVETDD